MRAIRTLNRTVVPRLLLIALLPWAIYNCMGGSNSPSWPPDANAPTATEQAVIEHVWTAMGVSDYPVWLYRDTWTPDRDGHTWGDIGRASNVACPSKHGAELCAWGVWLNGAIRVLHMTPETVDLFNAMYQPPETVDRELFTLRRFAGLLIYERMHQLGWPYEMTDARREAEQDYRARVDWGWVERSAAQSPD